MTSIAPEISISHIVPIGDVEGKDTLPALSPSRKNEIRNRWKKGMKLATTRHRQLSIIEKFKLPSKPPTEIQVLRRSKKFQRIFLNKSQDESSLKSSLFCVLGIILSIVFTMFITVVPQHNAIGNSQYWYEPIMVHIFSWGPIAAVHLVSVCHFCIGTKGKHTIRACVIAYVVGTLNTCAFSGIMYISWVYFGGFTYPMPFHGYLLAVLTWYAMFVVFWIQCPKEWRSNRGSRKKLIFCLLFLNMLYVGEIAYKGIRKSFLLIPKDYHWPLIFVLLIVRESNTMCLGYLGKKIAGYPDLSVDILATLFAGLRHTMFLTIDIGAITTEIVSYSILAIDFVINLFFALVIIWCHRHPSKKNLERQWNYTLSLIVNESVEIVMPISYALCLLLAYYGPNAEILGNIKSGDWQYAAIEDIVSTFKWAAIIFTVDMASGILSFIVLWWCCKINILRMYLQVQDCIWYIFAIEQAYMLTEVRIMSL